MRLNGKIVNDYNFQIENYSYPGIITHEMMHTLSAPDLYRYYANGSPVGVWDLMASTNYSSPQGLSAYMKHKYGGWIDSIPEIKNDGTYTLYPANGDSPYKTAYKYYPKPFGDEYIVLEYRKTSSNIFEGNLPGSGILIYRINENFLGSTYYNGSSIFDEVYLFRPNGTVSNDGTLTSAHFAKNNNRTSFDSFTNPYPFYCKGDRMENFFISDITEAGDSIQFTFRKHVDDTLIISTDKVELTCKNNDRFYLSVTSNTQWKIVYKQSCGWLNIPQNGYVGTGNFELPFITQSENTNPTNSRTCQFTIFSMSNSYDITVTQRYCGYVGIEGKSQYTGIKLFPNPTNESITVSYPGIDEVSTISIFSLAGQLLYSTTTENNQTTIDISGFAPGVYYLKLYSQKQSSVKSFIVK